MRTRLFFTHVLISVCLLSLSSAACGLVQVSVLSTATPDSLPAESVSTAMPSLPDGGISVVFVKDGNIHVWEEATQQTRTLVDSGDVVAVTASEDGRTIVFTRRSWAGDVLDGYEQFALWTMDREGGNPRELVPVQDLRQRLDAGERESSNFYQLGWVPQSHKLIFSGTKYIVQAEGFSHAIPQGAYLVDTDTGSVTVLAEATENLGFLASPDGRQIALMSPDSLGFIDTDGGNRRQDVLTYAQINRPGPFFPTGVWTQDSRAFVMTGSFEEAPEGNLNFTIWRIPMDGSTPKALAAITGSVPSSVTFSPDGKSVSFLQPSDPQSSEAPAWAIMPLIPEAGPLALPFYGKGTFYANLHWSPAGEAFAIQEQDLFQLCPDAKQDSQVCGEPVHLGSRLIMPLQWVDDSRFVFVSSEPNALSLGRLDGTITPIATWAQNDLLPAGSFSILR